MNIWVVIVGMLVLSALAYRGTSIGNGQGTKYLMHSIILGVLSLALGISALLLAVFTLGRYFPITT